jgi:4-hydroxy-tetrahydrodipicolinate synthase
MTNLRGSYSAIITPFTDDGGRVDTHRLAANVRDQAAGGMTGVVPCGTTGETPTLTAEEYETVIDVTLETARAAGLTVIAGAGSNNTAHAVHLHNHIARAGVDASLQVTPYYNKPSAEGLYRHFMTIADSAALPIVLYNVPGRTGVKLEFATIQRLASHPNIVAVKDATGDLELAGRVAQETELTVLSGDDPLTLPMAMVGGQGIISVVGNLVPDRVARLTTACLDGNWEEARRCNNELLPIGRAMLTLDSNPIPLKTALALLGRDTGVMRLPLCPATDEVRRAVADVLKAAGIEAAAPVTT